MLSITSFPTKKESGTVASTTEIIQKTDISTSTATKSKIKKTQKVISLKDYEKKLGLNPIIFQVWEFMH